MGSVKDLKIISPAYENQPGTGRFGFSDRYSLFDWGWMDDLIKNKGKALLGMTAFNFEGLEKRGKKIHYNGLIKDGNLIRFSDLEEMGNGSDIMAFNLAIKYNPIARKFVGDDRSPRVTYDYSLFENNRGKINNYLIPLEIIFRNGLPKGSSIFKKLDNAKGNEKKIKQILGKLGLKEIPKEGTMLPKPIIEYTTKLEAGDRSLTEDEAYKISGLRDEEFQKIGPLALEVNEFISERAEQTGLYPHWDGKVEMIYFNEIKLADVIGTLDEDRFGDRLSKEFLRQWFKLNQPEWPKACDEFKKTGEGWQERCPIKPIRLPPELVTLVSQLYMSGCNKYTGREIFISLELEEVIEKLKVYRD